MMNEENFQQPSNQEGNSEEQPETVNQPEEQQSSGQTQEDNLSEGVSTPAPEATLPEQPESLPKPLETDTKVFAALSYLSVLFVIPWVVKKDNSFVKFHLQQGIALFAIEVVVLFVLWLIEAFFGALFGISAASLLIFLNKIYWVFFGVVSIVGIYYVFIGQTQKIPVLKEFSKYIKI